MVASGTLLFGQKDITGLLKMDECMGAVERAFQLYAEGNAPPPKMLGIHADKGGFHIKAGILHLEKKYFIVKSNANFPQNAQRSGLPTIQGVVILADGDNGSLLALMDSASVTTLRTGAATGIAAKYLSTPDADTATIIGCGSQGRVSIRALLQVRRLKKVYVFDLDDGLAKKLADELSNETGIDIEAVTDFQDALARSKICVTCTTSEQPFLFPELIMPGTFIAAVGADNEHKQELFPELLAGAKVVTDITEQCVSIGELRHAINGGLMRRSDIYAELGEIIIGRMPGRSAKDEIIIFDSTGTALQDAAAAALIYEKALASDAGLKINFIA